MSKAKRLVADQHYALNYLQDGTEVSIMFPLTSEGLLQMREAAAQLRARNMIEGEALATDMDMVRRRTVTTLEEEAI